MAIETLRPDGAGSECNIDSEFGCSGCNDHFECVDEAVADGDATKVRTNNVTYQRDLYSIDDTAVGAGIINSVKVYANAVGTGAPDQNSLKICVKPNVVVYEVEFFLTNAFAYYSNQWNTNPDGGNWTWAQINDLEVGVALRESNDGTGWDSAVTQVYVEVDYTPAAVGWTGKISGVTDPAEIAGVAVADIASVKGVA